MNDELKKCPFCGSEGEILFYGNVSVKYASCKNTKCSLMTPLDEWQSRPIEDALRAKLDEAKEALEVYAVKEAYHGDAKDEWKLAADTLQKLEA